MAGRWCGMVQRTADAVRATRKWADEIAQALEVADDVIAVGVTPGSAVVYAADTLPEVDALPGWKAAQGLANERLEGLRNCNMVCSKLSPCKNRRDRSELLGVHEDLRTRRELP